MFKNPKQEISKDYFLYVEHIGKVISNTDPENIGRIKVSIKNIFSENPDEVPFCFRVDPVEFGTGDNLSTYSVPPVGSEVLVRFYQADINRPYYYGRIYTSKKVDASQNPDFYIRKDPAGNVVKTNLKSGAMEITLANPDINLTINGNLSATVNGNLDAKVNGTINVETSSNATIKASSVTVDAPEVKVTGTTTLDKSITKGFCGITTCPFVGVNHVINKTD